MTERSYKTPEGVTHFRMVSNHSGMDRHELRVGKISSPDNLISTTEVYTPHTVPVEGFSEEQEAWVRGAMEITGVSLQNVHRVKYEENADENRNWLGSMNYADGTITLYSGVGSETSPYYQALSTLLHEQGHSVSSYDARNDDLYGGREAREEQMHYYRDLAEQSAITGVALNGYHETLITKARTGEITLGRLYRETETIAMQMRTFNEKELRAKQDEQRNALARLQDNGEFLDVEFVQIVRDSADGNLVGNEKSMAVMFRTDHSLQAVEARIDEVREFAEVHGNVFQEKTKAEQVHAKLTDILDYREHSFDSSTIFRNKPKKSYVKIAA